MRTIHPAVRVARLASALVLWGVTGQAAPNTLWFDKRLPVEAERAPWAQDSPAARQAAVNRLRAAQVVPGGAETAPDVYGTASASREFVAPPILETPRLRWLINQGWWGAWSPLLFGNTMLTGSCNNEGNKGLSALEPATGKTLWRIPGFCDQRAGSFGSMRLFPLSERQVLMAINNNTSEHPGWDYYVVDSGLHKIVRSLKPVKRNPDWLHFFEGIFVTNTYSAKENTSYLNGMNPDMSELRWRLDIFRAPCADKLAGCPPVFSAPAYSQGVMYVSATAKNQAEPPTRMLHAIAVDSGRLLWVHTRQPILHTGVIGTSEGTGSRLIQVRADDGPPMVAGGLVIIRANGMLGATSVQGATSSYALRALDAQTGQLRWTTASLPADFKQEWLPGSGVKSQEIGNYLAAGGMLVAEVFGSSGTTPKLKELWAYRLSDGKLAWRRSVSGSTSLMASAGGVVYAVKPDPSTPETVRLEGLDALTGTQLWTMLMPSHNISLESEWGIADLHSNAMQGPTWRIDRSGAILGVSLTGAFAIH